MQSNNLSVVHGDGTTRNIATAINSFSKYIIELDNPEFVSFDNIIEEQWNASYDELIGKFGSYLIQTNGGFILQVRMKCFNMNVDIIVKKNKLP